MRLLLRNPAIGCKRSLAEETIIGELVTIPVADGGRMPAWVAHPAREPAGAVLLLHEIFGLNRSMRALAEWIMGLGHIALVPDLWWREAPGELDPDAGPPAWTRAMALLRDLDEPRAVADAEAALGFARRLPGCTGSVAVVGFCLGGRLAMRLAAAGAGEAHVSYYGVGIETMLQDLSAPRAPLLLHLAARDRFVPPPAQAAILSALAHRPDVEVVVHPAADHAFARAGARSFDAEAAAVAHARTAALLARCLRSAP
jgi:carboxymethylenebutenolidase